jgi:adenylate cyclase
MARPFARRVCLCALPALALALAAQTLGLFDALERYSWDARARLMARPSAFTDQIRVIALDQSSLNWGERENGLSWPWPRELYALAVDFCRRAGAASLSLDVIFSEPSLYGVEDDLALGRAGAAYGRLVLAFAPGAAPVPEIRTGAKALGFVNQNPDPDGVYRSLYLSSSGEPSLSLAAYTLDAEREKENLEEESSRIAAARDSTPRILNFRGKNGTHQSYSAAAVIQSELRLLEGSEPVIRPEALAGRHVLFGFTAPALLDLRPSPTDGGMSGVEIHATALDNLLAGDFLRSAPGWMWGLPMVLISLGAAYGVLRPGRMRKLAATAALTLALPPLLSIAAYRALWQWPLMPVWSAGFLSLALAVLLAYATEGRQRRFLKSAFSQYLSPQVIGQILEQPERLKLGGEKRELSIYFSDLAGFSGISERLGPEELTRLLNEYLTLMTEIILEEGGTIDKYEGDAVIAFWNAPGEQPDHASRALRAALRCQAALAEEQKRFRALAGRDLSMRIGLNTGEAVVGNMGSRSRFDYTMLGDSVNLASRLEGANKVFGTGILASQALFEKAGAGFAGRELGLVRVVGRREAVRVFEPLAPEEAADKAGLLEAFALALSAFQAGRLDEAGRLFADLAEKDAPSAAYLRHWERFELSGRQGVWELTEK